MAGDANHAGGWRIFKSITFSREARLGDDAAENLITLCASCHQKAHGQMDASHRAPTSD